MAGRSGRYAYDDGRRRQERWNPVEHGPRGHRMSTRAGGGGQPVPADEYRAEGVMEGSTTSGWMERVG